MRFERLNQGRFGCHTAFSVLDSVIDTLQMEWYYWSGPGRRTPEREAAVSAAIDILLAAHELVRLECVADTQSREPWRMAEAL